MSTKIPVVRKNAPVHRNQAQVSYSFNEQILISNKIIFYHLSTPKNTPNQARQPRLDPKLTTNHAPDEPRTIHPTHAPRARKHGSGCQKKYKQTN
ncbi:MAG: hypothetical protein JJ974_00510 [Phycisphaerales bacterium]|nr:hypothetical protein [Phycisphaerales bacterium]